MAPNDKPNAMGLDLTNTSREQLAYAFTHVPWIEFNVTAKANLEAFTTNNAVRDVVTKVAQTTVKNVTNTLVEDLKEKFDHMLQQAVDEATKAVEQQIIGNMTTIFKELNISASATTLTEYQHLKDEIPGGNVSRKNGVPSVHPDLPISTPKVPKTPSRIPNDSVNLEPDLSTGEWIWTPEQPYTAPPSGARGFRTAIPIPAGKVDSLIIDVACDNFQSLYVNGNVVGFGLDWNVAKRWSITFEPTSTLVIAIYASNDPITMNVAGVIVAAVARNSATGKVTKIKTDASWKCTLISPPKGFERPDYNDEHWEAARVEGPYGIAPWGPIAKPTKLESITQGFTGIKGVADSPKAHLASAAPVAASSG